MERELRRPVSMGYVVASLLATQRLKPSDFQGAWKMSDEEAENLAKSIRETWSTWRLVPRARQKARKARAHRDEKIEAAVRKDRLGKRKYVERRPSLGRPSTVKVKRGGRWGKGTFPDAGEAAFGD